MATNQSNSASRKKRGFLLFALGCIIAVSGAAKLNETERVLRIRQSAQKATMKRVSAVVRQIAHGATKKKAKAKTAKATRARKKVLTTFDVVTSLYQKGQAMAQPRARLIAQAKTLLQVNYIKLVHLSVAKLSIRQPRAVGAELKSKLLKALARKLNPVPSRKQGRKKKEKIERTLVTAMAQQLMGSAKKPKKPKTPRAVKDVVALLIDQAVRHLTPYVMWEALLDVSAKKIEAIAVSEAKGLARPFATKIQQPIAASDAKKLVHDWLAALVSAVGKRLKLKSVERTMRPNVRLMALLSHRIQPKLKAAQASTLTRRMSVLFGRQVAATMARALAMKVGARLQFSLTQVSAAGPKAAKAPKAAARPAVPARAPVVKASVRARPATSRPATRRAPVAKPASRPVVRVPVVKAAIKTVVRVVPVRRAPVAKPVARPTRKTLDPLMALAKTITARPPIRPQRVAFLRSTKRIGGWPSTLPIFLFGAFLALLGLLMWRSAIRAEVEAKLANQEDDDTNPFSLLRDVQDELLNLSNDIESLDEEGVCARIDEVLSKYILPFAEVRQGVIEQLGMRDGAEILVTVAFGERMLNRVWSAASDGHLPEALSVFPDAKDALAEAHTLAQASLAKA